MKDFISLDFETSGLVPGVNAPTQLGLIKFENGLPVEESAFETLIGPKRHYKSGKIERVYDLAAMEVSGISWKAIKEAPPAEEVVKMAAEWAKKWEVNASPILAYRSSFDHGFWSDLLFLAGGYNRFNQQFEIPCSPFLGGWHCAMELAKVAVHGLPNYKLETTSKHLGIERQGDGHTALSDARVAGELFAKLMNPESVQIETVKGGKG